MLKSQRAYPVAWYTETVTGERTRQGIKKRTPWKSGILYAKM